MRQDTEAFTLIELLMVLAIVAILLVLLMPALSALKTAGDISKAAADVSGALEEARAYAMANNTYVWAGFFEEDGSQPSTRPGTAGVGRIVVALVASKDGSPVYSPTSLAPIDPTKLLQISPLLKINNMHLATFTDGTGEGNNFDTRPAIGSNEARIGAMSPSTSSLTPFPSPLSGTAQYSFSKAIQFSPRGEARIDNDAYSIEPNIEIGLQNTHGATLDTANQNPVALQIPGVGGNVTVYRK